MCVCCVETLRMRGDLDSDTTGNEEANNQKRESHYESKKLYIHRDNRRPMQMRACNDVFYYGKWLP